MDVPAGPDDAGGLGHLAVLGFAPERSRGCPSSSWLDELARGIERARYWAGPVLIVGGEPEQRANLAALIHSRGPTRDGFLRRVDCRAEPEVRRAFELCRAGGPERGTTFFDYLEALPRGAPRELLDLLESASGAVPAGGEGTSRLMAGIHDAEARSSAASPCLDALVDTLDKWRIELARR